jgi:hypothetical protein
LRDGKIGSDLAERNNGSFRLAELKVFERTLTITNRQQLVRSFRNKYGVADPQP